MATMSAESPCRSNNTSGIQGSCAMARTTAFEVAGFGAIVALVMAKIFPVFTIVADGS